MQGVIGSSGFECSHVCDRNEDWLLQSAMTRKRLRKNAKYYGAKKRAENMSNVVASRSKTQKTNLSNGKISKTKEQFRPVNATVGREFCSHNDVWQPAVMDIGMDDSHIHPCGLTGLTNLGNTCYMNAAVQALSNCPPFSDFFRSLSSVAPFASKVLDNDVEPPVSRSFRRLLQALWSEERNGCISPQPFLVQVRHHCPQFRGWAQQDAQEFIRCLLDLLHRELRQPVFAWEYRSAAHNCNRQVKEASSCCAARGRSISSCSSSRTSDDERYETADSGWSSDGELPPVSKRGKYSEAKNSDQLTQIPNCPVNQKESVESNNRNMQNKVPIYYRSLVTEVFDGQLRSVVKCLTCHHLSETCETFQDLSLSIPTREQLEHIASYSANADSEDGMNIDEQKTETVGSGSSFWQWSWWFGGRLFRSIYRYLFGDLISLNDALTAFFSPDDLRGENMYSCEKCAKLRNGVKICKIISPPEILCIHLKRFRHELSYSTKVRTTVTFPVHDLDLTPFITNSEAIRKPVLYDLVAFITHYGGSAESGHYVAYCKNEVDDNWYEFDDTVITRLETPVVLTKEAYVLFYQRQSSRHMDIIRARVRQMLEEDAGEKTKMKAPLHNYISREWLHRLSMFSNPGPITNHDFLCQHSQILPRRAAHLTDYYATISSSLWDFLYEKFGGGPASSELHYCLPCQNEYQILKHKREAELKAYLALEGRLRKWRNDFPALTYGYYMPPNVIAKAWIDKWKAFIDGNEFEPPGSIDNSTLLVCSNTDDTKLRLRSSQYMQIPREVWLFFQLIYGGGPELLCIPEIHPSADKLQELIAKVDANISETKRTLTKEDLTNMPLPSYPSMETVSATASDVLKLPDSDLATDIVCSEK